MSLKSDTKFTKSDLPNYPEDNYEIEVLLPVVGKPLLSADLGAITTIEEKIDTSTRKPVVIGAELQAKAFVDGVKEGKTLAVAAKDAGVPVHKLMGSPTVQKQLQQMLSEYTIDGEIRKALSRATANQILLEGNYKERIDVMKVINADPEVGITNGPQVNVQTNIMLSDETRKAAESAMTIDIEGLD